jgi:hypothetical protein
LHWKIRKKQEAHSDNVHRKRKSGKKLKSQKKENRKKNRKQKHVFSNPLSWCVCGSIADQDAKQKEIDGQRKNDDMANDAVRTRKRSIR